MSRSSIQKSANCIPHISVLIVPSMEAPGGFTETPESDRHSRECHRHPNHPKVAQVLSSGRPGAWRRPETLVLAPRGPPGCCRGRLGRRGLLGCGRGRLGSGSAGWDSGVAAGWDSGVASSLRSVLVTCSHRPGRANRVTMSGASVTRASVMVRGRQELDLDSAVPGRTTQVRQRRKWVLLMGEGAAVRPPEGDTHVI
jgi:hypothetical protein